MELIYTVNKQANEDRIPIEDHPIFHLSVRNLLCLATREELKIAGKESSSDPSNDKESPQTPKPNCSVNEPPKDDDHRNDLAGDFYHLYICDIDCPWDIHHLKSYKEEVVLLRWHDAGQQFLLCTVSGWFEVWSMKDHLINRWKCTHKVQIEHEHFIDLCWFHNGIKLAFNTEKRDDLSYHDKFDRLLFHATLVEFGGRAAVGWGAVSASSMIVLFVLDPNSDQVKVVEVLGTREFIKNAAMLPLSSGQLFVAMNDGLSTIKTATITVTSDASAVTARCTNTASFRIGSPAGAVTVAASVSHLGLLQCDTGVPAVILLTRKHSAACFIELWCTEELKVGVHPLLQMQEAPQAKMFAKLVWRCRASCELASPAVSVALPQLSVAQLSVDAVGRPSCAAAVEKTMLQHIAVSLADGSVRLMDVDSLQQLTTTNLDVGTKMLVMQQSGTGCVLLGIDQLTSLYVMRTVNTRDPVSQVAPQHLLTVLEYNLVLGHDSWDVVACLKPPAVAQSLVAPFVGNFERQQPLPARLTLRSRFLAIKAQLLAAAGCHALARQIRRQSLLDALYILFRSVLSAKGNHEENLPNLINSFLQNNLEVELPTVAKALGCDLGDLCGDMTSMAQLQPLILWVVQQAIQLCIRATEHCSAECILKMREMILLIWIWSQKLSFTPQVPSQMGELDIVQHLYSLLTQIWAQLKEKQQLDDALLDACSQLASKVLLEPTRCGLRIERAKPTHAVFGETIQPTAEPPSPHFRRRAHRYTDVARHIDLGVAPVHPLRQCCRCSEVSLLNPNSSEPLLLTWELRWGDHCPCGGSWKGVAPSSISH